VLEPLEQPLHLLRPLRRLVGWPVRSLNLRGGEGAESAFFTGRHPAGLSAEAIRWGPTAPQDLPVYPLTVTQAKEEGKTPGMFVTDARGVRYLLKLDPVDAPELLSGAEVVTSKLLHALGYRVPSYEVVRVPPGQVRVSPEARLRRNRRHVPFTEAHLQSLLAERMIRGEVRVASSKILPGEVLGPAHFKRFRDCAEVRALRLAYAWVNNIDSKDHNSLLVWTGQATEGYVFDFGTALGADAGLAGPKHGCAGGRYTVDLREWWLEAATLGRHRSPCDTTTAVVSPAVGRLAPTLDPARGKPYAPNVAFQQMDARDARWMARRLREFSVAQLAAAVAAGQYHDPVDAAYLVDLLDRRRQAIIARYLDDGEE